MRRILFRGKRLYKDEWIEGCYIHIADSIHFIYTGEFELVQGKIHTGPGFLVFGDTVGQYTGLTDKNGTKIFEGDILSAHFDEAFPENVTFMEVGNNGFAFTLREAGSEPELIDQTDAEWCNERFEVVGNIHDDPELLGD